MGRLKLCVVVGLILVWSASSAVMAAEESKTLDVGDKAPNFKAESIDGKMITLGDTKGAKAVVVCFTCNNCPIAKAYEDRFVEFNKKYAEKGVKFVAINVNKGETLEDMKRARRRRTSISRTRMTAVDSRQPISVPASHRTYLLPTRMAWWLTLALSMTI